MEWEKKKKVTKKKERKKWGEEFMDKGMIIRRIKNERKELKTELRNLKRKRNWKRRKRWRKVRWFGVKMVKNWKKEKNMNRLFIYLFKSIKKKMGDPFFSWNKIIYFLLSSESILNIGALFSFCLCYVKDSFG